MIGYRLSWKYYILGSIIKDPFKSKHNSLVIKILPRTCMVVGSTRILVGWPLQFIVSSIGAVDPPNCPWSTLCNWGLRIFIEALLGSEVITCDVTDVELSIPVWTRLAWFWLSNTSSAVVTVLALVVVLVLRLDEAPADDVTVLEMTDVDTRLVVPDAVELEEGDTCGRMEFVVISNPCCTEACPWIFIFWGATCKNIPDVTLTSNTYFFAFNSLIYLIKSKWVWELIHK